MPTAVRVRFNPADPSQYMILYNNGRITAKGGALDPMATSEAPPLFADTGSPLGPAADFQVIDWSAPCGYLLDWQGSVWVWGPSGSLPTAPSPAPVNWGAGNEIVRSFVMNPAGDGMGYYLVRNGTVMDFGGAPAIAAGPALPNIARRLEMQWSSKKYLVLDAYGGIHARQSAPAIAGGPYWSGWDIARALTVVDWSTGKGYLMDGFGATFPLNGAQDIVGEPYWSGWDIARDLQVIDDGSGVNPLTIGVLDGQGGVHVVVVSTSPLLTLGESGSGATGPADPTTDTTRPAIYWTYADLEGDAQDRCQVAVYREPDTAGFTNERQRVTLSGSPTGGTFKLAHQRFETAALAWNCAAGALQTALENLPNLEPGDVAVTGGPLPGSGLVVNFVGAADRAVQPKLQVTANALTGGTSPAPAVEETRVGADPFSAFLAPFRLATLDEQGNPNRRELVLPVDLPNGEYRVFAKMTDTSGRGTLIRTLLWEQDVSLPDTPVLSAHVRGGLAGIALTPSFPTSPADAQFVIEYSDDYNPGTGLGTWNELRYATADEIAEPDTGGGGVTWRDLATTWRDLGVTWRSGSTGSTGYGANMRVDYEAPFGSPRWFRCRQYTANPYLASESSTPVVATLTGSLWAITNPADASQALEIFVAPPDRFSREAPNTFLYPAGSEFALAGSTGPLRRKVYQRMLRLHDVFQARIFDAMIEPNPTLLLRDPFGNIDYVKIDGDVQWEHPLALPRPYEIDAGYRVRFYEECSVTFRSVRRPRSTDPDPFVVAPDA